jgi:hypothetical protein
MPTNAARSAQSGGVTGIVVSRNLKAPAAKRTRGNISTIQAIAILGLRFRSVNSNYGWYFYRKALNAKTFRSDQVGETNTCAQLQYL